MFSIINGTLKVGIRVTEPAVGDIVTGCTFSGLIDEYRVVWVEPGAAYVYATGRRWSLWEDEDE